MSAEEISELIDLYLKGACSPTQKELVTQWYEKYSVTDQEFYNGDTAQLRGSLEKSLSGLTEKINAANDQVEVPVKKVWPKRLIAAAILLISCSAALLFYNNYQSRSANFYANDIAPGKNKAILTLADGSKIALDDAAQGEIASQSGIKITKTTDGQLVYEVNPSSNATSKAAVYNTISTPAGGQYQVKLPDGTNVWLNAMSSLKFPASFAGLEERRVTLIGEGYFEVTKLEQEINTRDRKTRRVPFFVVTDKQEVEVLGTHFNICAYSDDNMTSTTLLEGSVNINHSTLLKPGEEAVNSGNSILVKETDTEEAVAWKNGKFKFSNENIKDLMRKLARWYDVEIIYDGQMTNKDFSGSVPRFAHVSKILDVLQSTNTVHFKVEGRRITVMP
ncbi:FecR family protein [Pedobacter hiemivivus]|uniref:FecR family protein n=1 Tax=Pedobacter hiemivivus TaxID=2530454 RepID=A0A4R0N8Q0_9SPHI|nr:FecR family protein [Pedobacter hiemivivus]TCC96538.1 FecR family protein [Pedobacter hiemivivus]